jgi:hypothetical protein
VIQSDSLLEYVDEIATSAPLGGCLYSGGWTRAVRGLDSVD